MGNIRTHVAQKCYGVDTAVVGYSHAEMHASGPTPSFPNSEWKTDGLLKVWHSSLRQEYEGDSKQFGRIRYNKYVLLLLEFLLVDFVVNVISLEHFRVVVVQVQVLLL